MTETKGHVHRLMPTSSSLPTNGNGNCGFVDCFKKLLAGQRPGIQHNYKSINFLYGMFGRFALYKSSPDITSHQNQSSPRWNSLCRLWQDLGYILGQPWLNLSYILGCQLGSDSRSAQSSQRWHQRFPLAAIPFDHQRSDALCSFSHHPNLNALNPLSPARPLSYQLPSLWRCN